MQTPYHPEEFIGKELKVVEANNKSLIGLFGKVVNETKNTITIQTQNLEEKTILKQGCKFTINNKQIIGSDINIRPEDRIKKKR